MNNTASLKRTDWGIRIVSLAGDRRAGTVVASLLLTALLVTFKPFDPGGEAVPEGGDVINQLGFGSLGALAVAALVAYCDPRKAAALISPWWLLLAGFLALSVSNALDPDAATRAALFTVIGMLAAAAVVTLPRDGDAYATVFATAGFAVVTLCYAGLVLFPDVAVHGGDELEPQHAGFWRGSFAHKNIAGPVMACLSFAGLYLWRHGWRKRGAALFLAALWFMANTGSKTTAGLVPLVMLTIMAPRAFGLPFLTPVLVWLALIGTGLATLGIVFMEPIKALAAEYFPELTYTGRTTLWAFLGERIAERPWTGWGFESLWGSPRMELVETSYDESWDVSGIVHGHNGWLDLAAIMGLPALAVGIIAFVAAPLRDFSRTPLLKVNVALADLFMMMMLFATLNAFLESFFFRRADPVWLFLVMATLGLRLTARFAIPASSKGG
ncbi:MAG: O-antigen ligase family protein [Rhizobiaceae bacterium]|nr:O-antigen ligase family protein [Rhizobiaceae bacterium]MCV0406070.1 O-antigen ligase family protein [Rhizobiaceae bacterium]